MHRSYTRVRPAGQSQSLPFLRHDGPSPEELRAQRVLNRVSISRELARELAGLAFGIPEKSERRI